MAIKIEMLRCFHAVAISGSLSAAAERLGRTPSALSMMLKQFEMQLGGHLFKSERKSELTALGEFVLTQATNELHHFERTVINIENFARSESGLVRIAAVPSVAASILPCAVRHFRDRFPGVWIEIRDMDSAAVLHELDQQRVDLGIATGGEVRSKIQRELLFSDAFGVVCRSDHPLAACKSPLAWSALGEWPFIANGLCENITDEVFQYINAASQIMVRNTTSLLAMVRAGVGVTVLPRLSVDSNDAELSFVAVADHSARRLIETFYRADGSLSPAATNFIGSVRCAVHSSNAHAGSTASLA